MSKVLHVWLLAHTTDFVCVIALQGKSLHMQDQIKSGNKEKNFMVQQKYS